MQRNFFLPKVTLTRNCTSFLGQIVTSFFAYQQFEISLRGHGDINSSSDSLFIKFQQESCQKWSTDGNQRQVFFFAFKRGEK
jgi:hypothetical protein